MGVVCVLCPRDRSSPAISRVRFTVVGVRAKGSRVEINLSRYEKGRRTGGEGGQKKKA